MFTTKKICDTLAGTAPRSHSICSSSPSPSPVRLSPEWRRPLPVRLPKKTASTVWAWSSSSTAETSRSTPSPSTSQPSPAVMPLSCPVAGRSRTSPFSMAKATFCRFGAPGMTARIRLPIVGSNTSMKCCPCWAGTCTALKVHASCVERTSVATTSTSAPLLSISILATSLSLFSSKAWITPFLTSRRLPPLWTATTNNIILTCSGSLFSPTQITSSCPSFSPVLSSPECVTHFSAFMLLK
mmetsp:Transcript_45661/g.122081  ORF Transcript_45661/g.122081 Transcript_45661/m.122081 type:complete len:241 (-) Transcript_45661:179-901(-)